MNLISVNQTSKNANYLPDEIVDPVIHPTATIRNSSLIGSIIVKENVHIVNAAIRADEGTPFYIDKGANIQDFVILHGYTTQDNGTPIEDNLINVEGLGYLSIYIGQNASISHGVLIHGPSSIGENTFVGFKSSIDKSKIGKNVEIGAHCFIQGVEIPDNIAIRPNAVITKQEDIEQYIILVTGINTRIAKVNHELAEAYN